MRFKVQNTAQGDTFVKVARSDDTDGRQLLAEYENATQAAGSKHPRYGRIAPRVLDHAERAIYFEHLSGHRDALTSLVQDDGSLSKTAFTRIQQIGEILAFIHDWDSAVESRTEFPSSFPLDLDRYLRINPLVLDLLGRLQHETHAALNDLNHKLGASVNRRCHIHGDFKPDNILLDETSVRIIDWELAGHGQPEHDFASFYAGVFTELIYRAARHSNDHENVRIKQLSIAADTAVLCTRRLLEAYSATGREMPDVAMLTQVIGAKLLVRTAMSNYLAAGHSPFATLIQQSAEHCLNHPKALTRLLSIPTSTRAAHATL